MRFIRRAHRQSLVFWLLALAIALRSLVAPGFMLDFNDDSPLGISIIPCSGWSGGEQLQVFDDIHAIHKQADSSQHDHQSENTLTSTSCGMWSTSSTFVQLVVINLDSILQFGPDRLNTSYQPPYHITAYQSPLQARAPPVSRLS